MIKHFVISKIKWIHKHRQKYLGQPPQITLTYVTGERINLWGQEFVLEIIHSNRNHKIIIKENTIIMQVRAESTAKQREQYMNEWYRRQLINAMLPVAERYEQIMDVHANEWRTKNMLTRWGTCNTKDKRIWLSIHLTRKHPECLEYVVVHELCHLLEPSHNQVFKGYMDQFLPNWKMMKQKLL